MLTVGYVAGIIALCISIVSFLLPNIFVLVLVAIVGKQRDAVTWSVIGRDLQRTAWPSLLRSDTASIARTPPSLRLLSLTKTLGVAVVTIAAFVTPLGLHNRISISTRSTNIAFSYAADLGPFGQGTPSRDPNAFYSRVCSENGTYSSCPFSSTNVTREWGPTNATISWNGTYDVRIPYTTAAMFSSHYDDHPSTVAGVFDLQWRQYSYYTSPDFNNGTRYLVAAYKAISSLLVDDTMQAVDGLLVDTHEGRIALRNHTVPMNLEYGAEWEEELMFISPESACVNTNLSFEFQIASQGTQDIYSSGIDSSAFVNLSIVDHGGFSDIAQVYPERPVYPGQNDSDLPFRAYKAAWINNVWTMFYLNVTNPARGKYSSAFQYVDSQVGKRFWLDPTSANTGIGHGQVQFSPLFGGYLPATSSFTKFNNYSDPRSKYPNPWHITSDNFSTAGITCQGAGGQDFANISNIAVNCGLMYGAAVRRDAQDSMSSLVAEPGSWWTQPLYSCATGLKADIKRVRFRWNGTEKAGELNAGLTVLNVTDKVYDSNTPPPYWAAERLQSRLADMGPLWGPISREMADHHDEIFDVVQAPQFWIPGYPLAGLPTVPFDDNMPADAFVAALSDAYGGTNDYSNIYSGLSSTPIFARWQRLSYNEDTAALIPGLVWTDLVANAITSSRSVMSPKTLPQHIQPALQKRDSDQDDNGLPLVDGFRNTFAVYPYRNRITYNWLFAIPVFSVAALLAAVLFACVALAVVGRLPNPAKMSRYLNYTSAGRLLALAVPSEMSSSTSLHDTTGHATAHEKSARHTVEYSDGGQADASTLDLPTRDWETLVGRRVINLDTLSSRGANEQRLSPHRDPSDPSDSAATRRGEYEVVPNSESVK